ncbi:hypothetical protein Deima_1524 [Deinococcus maricopensis DSM 21211]|uniref:Uncharacterized protein n=1 Tax=Deinococcus maricopensis (strain DSM 21211 / LMG 22137 / NRRL B-23946 / LB-34) TaxID=709986 RepID=E8U7Y4_DEIML|nr:hypothetical protein Deima_1524 [Deinococcus maricopensis DSM 21211]
MARPRGTPAAPQKGTPAPVPLTRIDLSTDGLDPHLREALLEVIWDTLRISPGMVSADGNFELTLTRGKDDPEDAPVVRLNGLPYIRVTPQRLHELLRRRVR